MNYLDYFNHLMDGKWLNQICLFCPVTVSLPERFDILDELAFRLQIEYQKDVKFLVSNPFHTSTSQLDCIHKEYPLTEKISTFDVDKTVILANIQFPYFNYEDSWEKAGLKLFEYYRIPVLGFTTHEQCIKIYEK